MADREKIIRAVATCFDSWIDKHRNMGLDLQTVEQMKRDALELLNEQKQIIRCKDCKHWDKTTREEGNDCILGPWEDAVCDIFRDWDSYGELGESFRRTNGDWFCADGERR